jgi:hypothetical protein
MKLDACARPSAASRARCASERRRRSSSSSRWARALASAHNGAAASGVSYFCSRQRFLRP